MKKSHLLAVVIIAVAIGIIVTTAGDASSYVTFKEAKAIAANGKNTKIHVVGQLKKDELGNVTGIETAEDLLSFSFIMVDDNQEEQRVFYKEPMPTDFIRSEQVVIIGSFRKEAFHADKILLKCPSKYQEQEI
jgi:cytochrome c-type biogenesis protein CcmE